MPRLSDVEAAQEIADEQIGWWVRHGVCASAAALALGLPHYNTTWREIRCFMVGWLLSDCCHE
jgi:hypothetical protein